uniref:CNNM transmembrane domain-containing protein n=1 Tax=Brugia timori TaxID=42155 RepID=A0A0R3RDD1_9BILA
MCLAFAVVILATFIGSSFIAAISSQIAAKVHGSFLLNDANL